LPPVEYTCSRPNMQDTVEAIDTASLENLPIGADGTAYQWIDLDSKDISGILSKQADDWWCKRNISRLSEHPVEFLPLEKVTNLILILINKAIFFSPLQSCMYPRIIMGEI
jgi:hypothetical protein